MTKQYRHSKLWWIAKENKFEGEYVLFLSETDDIWIWWSKRELVENSNDREEVIEKDLLDTIFVPWKLFKHKWVNYVIDLYWEEVTLDIEAKDLLEKHMPKITEEDIDWRYWDLDKIIELLKEKWLYKE